MVRSIKFLWIVRSIWFRFRFRATRVFPSSFLNRPLFPQYFIPKHPTMDFHLGESPLFVRGFHLSLLQHGSIKPAEQLSITPEDNNSFNPNAVKISNIDRVFVGHIAIEQSCRFRSMLRKSAALDIQVVANFVRTEKETVTKPNGARYQATRVVVSIHYSARCHLDLYDQKTKRYHQSSWWK